MDRKYTKNNKAAAFLKRNIYYIIMLLCLAAIATMVTITLVKRSKTPDVDVIAPPNPVEDVDGNDINDNGEDKDKDKDKEEPKPIDVITPVVFACPVENVNIGRNYAMDSLVWHTTLRHYAVSPAIVFLGDEGTNVFAVYGGTVEDVTSDRFYGNKIVINHGDGLKTIYYSLEEVTVSKNQTITKGQKIGTMGTTATQEISDGSHLHFEVKKDDVVVNPYDYLDIGDK